MTEAGRRHAQISCAASRRGRAAAFGGGRRAFYTGVLTPPSPHPPDFESACHRARAHVSRQKKESAVGLALPVKASASETVAMGSFARRPTHHRT